MNGSRSRSERRPSDVAVGGGGRRSGYPQRRSPPSSRPPVSGSSRLRSRAQRRFTPAPPRRPRSAPGPRPLDAARFAVTERGVRFSFRVPASWERFSTVGTGGGPISFNRSTHGPQGAEAIIYWTSYPDGDYADPCARLLRPRPGRSAAALAAAVSRAPGTRLLAGPSSVTLGGRAATRLALTVHRKDIGCHPGFFYGWREVFGGALWGFTSWNDTIRVWIVEVEGTRLFIAGLTRPHTGRALKLEVRRIVESIRFRDRSTR